MYFIITVFSLLLGSILTFSIMSLTIIKQEKEINKKIQKNIDLQIDNLTPRDYIINKLSQNKLKWDSKKQLFVKDNYE